MPSLHIISLGCAKNQVDSECMLGLLIPRGITLTDAPENADVLLVNTCSFIEPAREESINTILELAHNKTDKQKLVVAGCLTQRYGDKLNNLLPEVDLWVDIYNEKFIATSIEKWLPGQLMPAESSLPIRITPFHYAYLRVADGCNHKCSFCAIPDIRGRYKSVDLNEILIEANRMADEGVVELNLIAQDTSFYGKEVHNNTSLAYLLKQLCKINDIKWIRLQYLYPASVTDELLNTIADEEKICPYIDIPLQHISENVLRHMKRPGKTETMRLIDKIRNIIPDSAIRTSMIVGYPVESDNEFNELVKFIEKTRFNHLGVFEYSREEDTPAYNEGDPVSDNQKLERMNIIMELQQKISFEINKNMIGKSTSVLIDSVNNDGSAVGRTVRNAPEVDNLIHIESNNSLSQGDIVQVEITRAQSYDLFAKIHNH